MPQALRQTEQSPEKPVGALFTGITGENSIANIFRNPDILTH
jgi:hypothetical protein